jgi:hypothetical protein
MFFKLLAVVHIALTISSATSAPVVNPDNIVVRDVDVLKSTSPAILRRHANLGT